VVAIFAVPDSPVDTRQVSGNRGKFVRMCIFRETRPPTYAARSD
jgi:hypothetical protein